MAVGVVGSCGSDDDHDPYAALSPEALRYVIPDSDDWSSGRLCPDGGACSGPITIDVIDRYDWFHITDLAITSDGPSDASVQAELSIVEARAADHADARVEVRAWGPDVDDVAEVLASGFEVWAGVDPDNDDYAVVFVAFDAEGRLAGVGTAAAEYFTVPVAGLAVEANAASGFAFLDPLMSR
jgi:hypothetical protein